MTETTTARFRGRSEERADNILEAATRLFGEEGFHAVSTRKIAAAAGVSEGTLFNYFSSKNELISGILARIYEELTERAVDGLRRRVDTRERLQFLAENHIQVMSRDNALFMRLIQSYMNVDIRGYTEIAGSVLHQLNLSYAWVFDFSVREGIERGEVRADINLSALRDLFFGGLEYCNRSLFLHDSFDQLPARAGSIVEPLWQSMRAGQTASTEPAELAHTCRRLEAVAARLEQLATD
ncbi:TetR/AcrR family transcriptional regulator [Parahaliea mediterranea]|uniref:TetR/AcrR family transcriptional regulator n=1 Tax=Parahaliea mediterranea TaxID=651086 RepID=A0A939IMV9_9GAMM|nr:TetR/AcrR family transcriptional regulator [Parahaliea mediterranea]MBN7797940.1 TetR/AcrR family transcriptional regulator [Parahaliea mediterranea]